MPSNVAETYSHNHLNVTLTLNFQSLFKGDKNTRICGTDKIKCYNDAEDKLLEHDFVEGLKNVHSAASGCNCLPACTSITYDAEISQAKFDWIGLFKAFNNPLDEFPG